MLSNHPCGYNQSSSELSAFFNKFQVVPPSYETLRYEAASPSIPANTMLGSWWETASSSLPKAPPPPPPIIPPSLLYETVPAKPIPPGLAQEEPASIDLITPTPLWTPYWILKSDGAAIICWILTEDSETFVQDVPPSTVLNIKLLPPPTVLITTISESFGSTINLLTLENLAST